MAETSQDPSNVVGLQQQQYTTSNIINGNENNNNDDDMGGVSGGAPPHVNAAGAAAVAMMMQGATGNRGLGDADGNAVGESFYQFLSGFTRPESAGSTAHSGPLKPYVEQVSELRQRDKTTLDVSFEDVLAFDEPLAAVIEAEYYRFDPYLRQAVQRFVQEQQASFEGVDNREFHLAMYNMPEVSHLRDLNR